MDTLLHSLYYMRKTLIESQIQEPLFSTLESLTKTSALSLNQRQKAHWQTLITAILSREALVLEDCQKTVVLKAKSQIDSLETRPICLKPNTSKVLLIKSENIEGVATPIGITRDVCFHEISLDNYTENTKAEAEIDSIIRDKGNFENSLKLGLIGLSRYLNRVFNLPTKIFLRLEVKDSPNEPLELQDASASLLMVSSVLSYLYHRQPESMSASGIVFAENSDFDSVKGFELVYSKLDAAFDAGVKKLFLPVALKENLRTCLQSAGNMGITIQQIGNSTNHLSYRIGQETMEIIFVSNYADLCHAICPENDLNTAILNTDSIPSILKKHNYLQRIRYLSSLTTLPNEFPPRNSRQILHFWLQQKSNYQTDQVGQILDSFFNYFPWSQNSSAAPTVLIKEISHNKEVNIKDSQQRFWILHGKSGAGKSWHLLELAKYFCERGQRVYFFKAKDLFAREKIEFIKQYLRELIATDNLVLIIDALEDCYIQNSEHKQEIIEWLCQLTQLVASTSQIYLSYQDEGIQQLKQFKNTQLHRFYKSYQIELNQQQVTSLPNWCTTALQATAYLYVAQSHQDISETEGEIMRQVLDIAFQHSCEKGLLILDEMDPASLNDLLAKIAFLLTYSTANRLNLSALEIDAKTRETLKATPIVQINDLNQISFIHSQWQAHYTAQRWLNPIGSEEPKDWRDIRWRQSLLFVADLLDKDQLKHWSLPEFEYKQHVHALLEMMIHHLLSHREQSRLEALTAKTQSSRFQSTFTYHINYYQATQSYYNANYDDAIEKALIALENAPANIYKPGLFSLLANSYLDLREYSLAEALINKAFCFCSDPSDPQYPRFLGVKGRIALLQGQWQEAENLFNQKLQIHTENSMTIDILRDRGDLLALSGLRFSYIEEEQKSDMFKKIKTEYDALCDEWKALTEEQSISHHVYQQQKLFTLLNFSYALPGAARVENEQNSNLTKTVKEILKQIIDEFQFIDALSISPSTVQYPVSMILYQIGWTWMILLRNKESCEQSIKYLQAAMTAFQKQQLLLWTACAAYRLFILKGKNMDNIEKLMHSHLYGFQNQIKNGQTKWKQIIELDLEEAGNESSNLINTENLLHLILT